MVIGTRIVLATKAKQSRGYHVGEEKKFPTGKKPPPKKSPFPPERKCCKSERLECVMCISLTRTDLHDV